MDSALSTHKHSCPLQRRLEAVIQRDEKGLTRPKEAIVTQDSKAQILLLKSRRSTGNCRQFEFDFGEKQVHGRLKMTR